MDKDEYYTKSIEALNKHAEKSNEEVGIIQLDVGIMKTDVSNLKENFKETKEDVKEIKDVHLPEIIGKIAGVENQIAWWTGGAVAVGAALNYLIQYINK